MHPRFDADTVIEEQLNTLCGDVEGIITGHVISIEGPLLMGVENLVRDAVESRVAQGSADKLGVVLTTSGGLLEPVRRIVDVFRRHYNIVDFFIPDYSYSAGTVLTMSGDAIFMDYFSRLGPIDPQQRKGTKLVPALGYLEKWNELLEKDRRGELTTAELQVMLDCFDQAELHQFEEAKKESVTLLEDWLVRFKFKNWSHTETEGKPVTEEMKRQRAKEIGENLNDTRKWHTHGWGISRTVLERDVNLRIDDLDDPKNQALRDAVRKYHALSTDYMTKRDRTGRVHTKEFAEFY